MAIAKQTADTAPPAEITPSGAQPSADGLSVYRAVTVVTDGDRRHEPGDLLHLPAAAAAALLAVGAIENAPVNENGDTDVDQPGDAAAIRKQAADPSDERATGDMEGVAGARKGKSL